MKAFFTRALPLAILAVSATSYASEPEKTWREAFSDDDMSKAYVAGQTGFAAGEIGAGAFVLNSGKTPPRGALAADPVLQLEHAARTEAIKEITAKNPRHGELLEEKFEVDRLKARAADRGFADGSKGSENLCQFLGSKEVCARLSKHEANRAELKNLERSITARTEELVQAVKQGKTVPAGLEHAAGYYRNFRPLTGLQLAVGIGLVADGGIRMVGLLNNANPGFSPFITAGSAVVKKAPPAAAPTTESKGDSSMNIE